MKRVKVHVSSLPGSPYSQSAHYDPEAMLDRESHEDFDIRMWREHCTINSEGQVCVPMMGQKQCVDTAANKLGVKVPNRRGKTFAGFFLSGVLAEADAPIANGKPWTKDAAEKITIWANSNGKRGSGSRVLRRFPLFPEWHAEFNYIITDDIISKEVFEMTIRTAGFIVGVGRFRPENGGTNGRFIVKGFDWEDFRI